MSTTRPYGARQRTVSASHGPPTWSTTRSAPPPAGRLPHRLGEPALLARRDDEARAEPLEQRAGVGPVASHDRDDRPGPQPRGERDALLPHAGGSAVDEA